MSNSFATLRSHRYPVVEGAIAAGWDVAVAGPEPKDDASALAFRDFAALGVQPITISVSRGRVGPAGATREIRSVRQALQRVRPHVLHAVTPKVVVLSALAARAENVPAVVFAISGLGWLFSGVGAGGWIRRAFGRILMRSVLRHRNQAVVVQNQSDLLEAQRWKLQGPSLLQIFRGSGVDLEKFQPRRGDPSGRVVVFPGRLIRDKGILEFVEAARILRRLGVHARMVVCGPLDDGNPTAVSRAELDSWLLEGAIEYWGNRSDMDKVYADAAVVCLPSFREGLSLALAEAAAAGKAIVTTDVPGCVDVVQPGVSGLVVPARDSHALAEAIRSVLSDSAMRARMETAARAYAVAVFDVRSIVANHLSLYDALLQRCSPGLERRYDANFHRRK